MWGGRPPTLVGTRFSPAASLPCWPQPSTSERPHLPSRREARPRPASPSPPRAAPTPPTRASPRPRAPPGAAAPRTGLMAPPWARAPWSWRRYHLGPAPSPPRSSSRPFLAGRSCGAWRGSGSGGHPLGCRYGMRRRQRQLGPWPVGYGLRGHWSLLKTETFSLACSEPQVATMPGHRQGCSISPCLSCRHYHPCWPMESGAQRLPP